MIAAKQPFKTILLVFKVFGFNPSKIKNRHKIYSFLFFMLFGIGFWIFVLFSLFQSESLSDLVNRTLYAATVLELFFKTFVVFFKMADIENLFERFDSIFDKEDEKAYFEKARKVSMRLTIFQLLSVAPSVIIPILKSLYSGKLLVPLYQFASFKCSGSGFYLCLIYETFGVTYLAFLVGVLDLLPICFMMMITEYFKLLNEKIRNLNLKLNSLKEVQCIVQSHGEIKQ